MDQGEKMNTAPNDARVVDGFKRQLQRRDELIAAGSRPLGWKVGFGAPEALTKLGISGPLVGFMLSGGLLKSGEAVSISDWTNPVAEPEIAIHMGADLPGGADRAAAADAIAALGPAIELADADSPPEDPEQIVAGNIYHRGVVLGAPDNSRAGARLDGLRGRVKRQGEEVAVVDELEANTGNLIDIVRHVADSLSDAGETLRAGDVIIAGSVTPPIFLTAEDTDIAFDLEGIGEVSLKFG